MPWNLVAPGIPIDINDRLHITITTQVVSLNLIVRVKTILPDGRIQQHEQIYITTGDGTEDDFEMPIDSGYLIGVNVGFDTGPLTAVEAYCRLSLRRAETGTAGPYILLTHGYVSIDSNLSWPESPPMHPFEIEGVPVVVAIANPAAGANWAHTVPDGTDLLCKAVRFRFVTAVAVATRQVRLEFLSGANVIHQAVFTTTQVASLTYDYNLSRDGAAEVLTSTYINRSMPDVRVIGGNTIRVQTVNIQAADQFSAIVLHGLRRGHVI